MTYDPKRQLGSEPSPELTSYAKDFYTLLAVAGLLAIAYLAVSIWRPEWLV